MENSKYQLIWSKRHFSSKNYTKSLNCLNKYLNIHPSDEFALNLKGNCLYKLKKYQRALKYFSKAAELNSDNSTYLMDKGMCLEELNLYEEALECYKQVLDININDLNCLKKLENVLKRLKREEEAMDFYKKVLDESSKDRLQHQTRRYCQKKIESEDVNLKRKRSRMILDESEEEENNKRESDSESAPVSESESSYNPEISEEEYLNNPIHDSESEYKSESNENDINLLPIKNSSNLPGDSLNSKKQSIDDLNLKDLKEEFDGLFSEKSRYQFRFNEVQKKLEKIESDFSSLFANSISPEEFMKKNEALKEDTVKILRERESYQKILDESSKKMNNFLTKVNRIKDWTETILNKKNCMSCSINKKNIIFAPCGHRVICRKCYTKKVVQCPYCKKPIKSYIETVIDL